MTDPQPNNMLYFIPPVLQNMVKHLKTFCANIPKKCFMNDTRLHHFILIEDSILLKNKTFLFVSLKRPQNVLFQRLKTSPSRTKSIPQNLVWMSKTQQKSDKIWNRKSSNVVCSIKSSPEMFNPIEADYVDSDGPGVNRSEELRSCWKSKLSEIEDELFGGLEYEGFTEITIILWWCILIFVGYSLLRSVLLGDQTFTSLAKWAYNCAEFSKNASLV